MTHGKDNAVPDKCQDVERLGELAEAKVVVVELVRRQEQAADGNRSIGGNGGC